MLPIPLQVISEEINKTINKCDTDSVSDMRETLKAVQDMFYDFECYTESLERCLMGFIASSYCEPLEKEDAKLIIEEYGQKLTSYELAYKRSSGFQKMFADLVLGELAQKVKDKELEELSPKEKAVSKYLSENLNIKK